MGIRTVFFDLGGTLLIMRRDRIISRILTEAGYPVGQEQVHSAYYKAEPSWLGVYGGKTMDGDETEEAYRQLDAMIFRLLFPGKASEEVDRASGLMRRRWPGVEKDVPLELYPDAAPTLSRLKADGYTLGLVSNAPPDTAKAVQALGLPRYLSTIIISGVVGVTKPNPEIFRMALREAGSEARESIHVGDIYEADIVGAESAGIKGILLDRDGTHEKPECPTIRSLGQVYDYLS